MANKSGRFAPDFMIMQRRKEEEQRMVYEEKVRTDSTIGRVAHWEQKTSNRLCPCGLSVTHCDLALCCHLYPAAAAFWFCQHITCRACTMCHDFLAEALECGQVGSVTEYACTQNREERGCAQGEHDEARPARRPGAASWPARAHVGRRGCSIHARA